MSKNTCFEFYFNPQEISKWHLKIVFGAEHNFGEPQSRTEGGTATRSTKACCSNSSNSDPDPSKPGTKPPNDWSISRTPLEPVVTGACCVAWKTIISPVIDLLVLAWSPENGTGFTLCPKGCWFWSPNRAYWLGRFIGGAGVADALGGPGEPADASYSSSWAVSSSASIRVGSRSPAFAWVRRCDDRWPDVLNLNDDKIWRHAKSLSLTVQEQNNLSYNATELRWF